MRHTYLLLSPLLCPIVVLAKSDESHHPHIVARHKHKPTTTTTTTSTTTTTTTTSKVQKAAEHTNQVNGTSILKQNTSSHLVVKPQPAFDASIFHSAHPAFPFLLPGKTMPAEPKTRSRFGRECFRFIYAVTADLTTIDDASYFYHLFNRQCALGNNKTCNHWSDELLQAVKKKMMAVKLLGKDGHIGRSKHATPEEKFESRLPPTLTGITSYANWCDELYDDLAISEKDAAEAHQKAVSQQFKPVTLKVGKKSEPAVKAGEKSEPAVKFGKKSESAVKAGKKSEPAQKTSKKSEPTHSTTTLVEPARATKTPVEPARATKTPVKPKHVTEKPVPKTVDAKKDAPERIFFRGFPVPADSKVTTTTTTPSNCICVERDDGQHCRCAGEKNKAGSSESVPFKDVSNQLKGLDIAEQASAAEGNDKELDGVEALLHKARSAAEGTPKHKKHA